MSTNKNNNKNNKNAITNSSNISPLEQSLNAAKQDDLHKRLKNAIYMKKQMRYLPKKKEVNEQQKTLKTIMKHPEMTPQILDLYLKAIEYSPKHKLATPVDILDHKETFKAEYYQYILSLIKNMKENNTSINNLDKLLDNAYGRYMSTCIGCPLNPFKKNPKIDVIQETQPKVESKVEPKVESKI